MFKRNKALLLAGSFIFAQAVVAEDTRIENNVTSNEASVAPSIEIDAEDLSYYETLQEYAKSLENSFYSEAQATYDEVLPVAQTSGIKARLAAFAGATVASTKGVATTVAEKTKSFFAKIAANNYVAAATQKVTTGANKVTTWFNGLSKTQKGLVIAGGVTATALVAYGIYKLVKKEKKETQN